MVSEITEEDNEDTSDIIHPEVQKKRIRQIIEYQKSMCSSPSFSSPATSCSSPPLTHKGRSLLDLTKGERASLRRLFEMEHSNSATHFKDFSASPMIKPLPLWDQNLGNCGQVLDRETRITNRKLSRTKSFERLPGYGCCRCRGLQFRLKSKRLRVLVCGRK